MTINAPASVLLAMYIAVGDKQGVDREELRGTIQNDILKEYIARNLYIYPPESSMRLITDIFEFCAEETPSFNTISISGYHIREAGSTAAQEIAFTLGDGIEYVQAALDAGLDVDDFAPQLSFFFNSHNTIFEEVAKFRAARRLWAKMMEERFGAENPKSKQLKFHTQTGGSTLTAQQVENNVVRVGYQALAAVLGGTQSLHTNGKDEAVGLPTEQSVQNGAANPADSRSRVRRGRHNRPTGRELLRRVADRRTRSRGPRTHRGSRRTRRDAPLHRGAVGPAPDSGRGLRAPARTGSWRPHHRRRQRVSGRRRTRAGHRRGRRGRRAGPAGQRATVREERDDEAVEANLTRSGGPPRATRTSRPTSSTP